MTVEGPDWGSVHGADAYDLDVAGIDSYYVGVGAEDVLVHSCTMPNIGNKLDYLFGRATGTAHNIERSKTCSVRWRASGSMTTGRGTRFFGSTCGSSAMTPPRL